MNVVEAAVHDYRSTVRHADPVERERRARGAERSGRELVDSFLSADAHPYWPYEWLPLPRHRIAQALDAYRHCLAGRAERRELVASAMYRRHKKFLAPRSLPVTAGWNPRALALRTAYRQVAQVICAELDQRVGWEDLATLDALLLDDRASRGWFGQGGIRDQLPVVDAVQGHVWDITGGLDLAASDMLVGFAVTAAAATLDEQGTAGAWRPLIQEGLRLYLSLVASGATRATDAPVTRLPEVPDDDNAFPAELTDATAWAGVRTWKFRPSPYLRELVAAGRQIGPYLGAARQLALEVGRRASVESPTVTTADVVLYAHLLDRWSSCADPADLCGRGWPDLMWEPGGPFGPPGCSHRYARPRRGPSTGRAAA